MECLTVSKAFEKSTAYTMTYLLLASMEVIVWRMEMRAAVVEPRVEMQTGQILFESTVDRGERDR